MRRFKNLLVLYGGEIGSEATLERATALAKRNQARLTVLDVLPKPFADVRELAIEERTRSLDRLTGSVRAQGVDARVAVRVGIPYLEVTREVMNGGHDLVLLSGECRFSKPRARLADTALQLMRKCPCPVWVTKAHDRSYNGILAAVDPMHEGVAAAKLNRTILDLSASLARLEEGTLHIVHCWQLVGVEAEAYRPEVPPEVLDRLRGSEKERRQKEINELLSRQDLIGIPYRLHLIEGQPGQVIPELATKESIELVVMGTVCRTGIAGFFVGNTAEAVLPEIDCALLTVKPPGFVSPIVDRSGLPVRDTVKA